MDAAVEVQRLVDRQAIVDLLHAYCSHVDLFAPAAVAELFTDECVVDYGPGLGPPTVGRAALEQRLASGLRHCAATSHHVSNIEIDLGDDTATSCAYVMAWHGFADGRPDAVVWGRYHDRVVRLDGRWLIAERVLRVAGQRGFDIEWHPIGRASTEGAS